MENADAAPANEPAPLKTNVEELITRLYDRRDRIRTLIIGTIGIDGKSSVEFSGPINAPGLSHIARSIDVKLDRYYSSAMFPPQPNGPVAGVRGQDKPVPRAVRRLIKKAERRVHKRAVKNGGPLPTAAK